MDIFDFPPLFTLQRNVVNQEKQCEIWLSILDKSKSFNFLLNNPIFENPRLGRRMSPELFQALGNFLVKKQLGDWEGNKSFLFFKKPLAEWAVQIYDWAVNNGKLNTVESLVSLTLEAAEFRDVPVELIYRATQLLEKSNQCELLFQDKLDIMSYGLAMSHIARFVCEVTIESNFPPKIFAYAMKYFFVFQEFTASSHNNAESLILAITCLLLSVKANESLLNSAGRSRLASRTALLIDNSIRSILAYADSKEYIDAELFCSLGRKIKESVARSELTLLRVVGNSLNPSDCSPSEWTSDNIGPILQCYSSPTCLS